MLHVTVPDKLLPPLISRFRDIHFKPYTEEEFVEIVVNVLDREEGADRDIGLLIADGVYNRLRSSNIRECVRIARLAKNDSAQVNRIIDTFVRYDSELTEHYDISFAGLSQSMQYEISRERKSRIDDLFSDAVERKTGKIAITGTPGERK